MVKVLEGEGSQRGRQDALVSALSCSVAESGERGTGSTDLMSLCSISSALSSLSSGEASVTDPAMPARAAVNGLHASSLSRRKGTLQKHVCPHES